MREDIYGVLKNALERGDTIEEAIQSLVNSGYNDIEVREAAKGLTSGAMTTIDQVAPMNSTEFSKPAFQRPEAHKQLKTLGNPQATVGQITRRRRSGTGKIILLIIVLLFLVGALVATIIFRDSIVNFLTDLF